MKLVFPSLAENGSDSNIVVERRWSNDSLARGICYGNLQRGLWEYLSTLEWIWIIDFTSNHIGRTHKDSPNSEYQAYSDIALQM